MHQAGGARERFSMAWRALLQQPSSSPAAVIITLALILALILRRLNVARTRATRRLPANGGTTVRSCRPPAADGKRRLLEGLRVVEIGTVVAAPIASRLLSDYGAEVVKVEEAEGDSTRKLFLEYEQPRTQSATFDFMNAGKASVQLDLKTQRAELMRLLASADVLVVNTRVESLKRMQLWADSVREALPHLIYAHVSAFGTSGPEANGPGYDVGAFWAASGLAASVQDETSYSHYPPAFGDINTGMVLFGGVLAALAARLRSGLGATVQTSLLHSGIWAASPWAVQSDAPSDETEYGDYARAAPPGHPLHACYKTADGFEVALCARTAAERQAAADGVRVALGIAADTSLTLEVLQAAIEERSAATLEEALTAARVPHARATTWSHICESYARRQPVSELHSANTGLKSGLELGPKVPPE